MLRIDDIIVHVTLNQYPWLDSPCIFLMVVFLTSIEKQNTMKQIFKNLFLLPVDLARYKYWFFLDFTMVFFIFQSGNNLACIMDLVLEVRDFFLFFI